MYQKQQIINPGIDLETLEELEMSEEANLRASTDIMLNPKDLKIQAKKVKIILDSGTVQERISAKRSDYAQALLYLEKGTPFRLNNREYLKKIYDMPQENILLCTARQVEKSTSAAAWSVIDCCIKPNFSILYVSPAADQTRNFSTQKVKPMMEESPLVKKYFINNNVEQQVFNKGFLNGSRIMLRYSFLTADRIRGISASRLNIDEVQDILTDNIPIIEECLSHAPNPHKLYTGTPKTFDNPLTKLWEGSNQHEWVIKCESCNEWNVLGIKNIGKIGLICSKCGRSLNSLNGRWARMTNRPGSFMGFRISQLMVHWKQDPQRWHQDIILAMEGPNKVADNVFYNEKLGVPYDSSDKPITREEIIKACDNTVEKKWRCTDSKDDPRIKGGAIFGGIDWGTGDGIKSESGKKKHSSYTVLTLSMMNSKGRFWTFYFKKYTGAQSDPNFIKDDVLRIHHHFGVTMWGVDWGFGWGMNNQLMRDLPAKVIQFQYVPNQKLKRKWDAAGYKFQLARSMVMSEFFNGIRRGEYQFPPWNEFEWISNDILCIFNDYSTNPATRNQLYYNHPYDQPDDFTHSIIMSRAVHDIFTNRP